MGSSRATRVRGLTVSHKWSQWIDETDETPKYRRVGDVLVFDTPSEETPRWEDLDGDWEDDLGEAGER